MRGHLGGRFVGFDVGNAERQHFLAGVAEHPAATRIHFQKTPLWIEQHHSIARRLEQSFETRLALAQAALRFQQSVALGQQDALTRRHQHHRQHPAQTY